MDQTTDLTITEAESQVMRSILTPLRPIMEEATPTQTLTEDDIFFNIALPLLMLRHYRVVWLTRVWRRLCDPQDDTKSCGLSVRSFVFVRSVWQHKVTPWS